MPSPVSPCMAALMGALALTVFPSCSTTALRGGDERLLFTVETLRRGGVLVPLPFEEEYASSGRKRNVDGSLAITYRFEPPESAQFPLFLKSRSVFYRVPGEAGYGQRVLRLREAMAGIGDEDRVKLPLPGLDEEADVTLVRDAEGTVAAFLLTVRTGNRLFLLALAGSPAQDPSLWTGEIVRCVRALKAYGRPQGGPQAPSPSPWLHLPGEARSDQLGTF